ncbi:MAG: methionyl-tRNA formyltransferase [Polyangiaceae bacterium]
MRALFFGTPAIAVPALEALASLADVAGVVCQPDRPAGRGLELRAPPVKERALALGLEVVQPTKIRTEEFADWVRARQADVALVIAYGRILPPAVLAAPRRGCMNLHASILPRYRGAAPITWAIVRGETETGISLMQMDEGCDTGPVFSITRTPIGPDQTADELFEVMGRLAADVVRADLARAVAGELGAAAQDSAAATEAPLLEKSDGRVPWAKAARAVHDHVRGMTSWPGATTSTRDGKGLKLLSTRVAAEEGALGAPGTVLRADRGGVEVACGQGALRILRAQRESKRAADASDLVSGRALAVGDVLGFDPSAPRG